MLYSNFQDEILSNNSKIIQKEPKIDQNISQSKSQTLQNQLKSLQTRNQIDMEVQKNDFTQGNPNGSKKNMENYQSKTKLNQSKIENTSIQYFTDDPKQDIYEPDKIPPNWLQAENHTLANKVGTEQIEQKKNLKLCHCCGRTINKEPLKTGCHLNQLSFLGVGYVLYYEFYWWSFQVMIVIILTNGLYNIFSNAQGNECISFLEMTIQINDIAKQNLNFQDTENSIQNLIFNNCATGFIQSLSMANKQSQVHSIPIQDVLNLSGLITLMLFMYQIRRGQMSIIKNYDNQRNYIKPQDYTVLVSNIPKGLDDFDYEAKLKQYFEKFEVKIESINFLFNLKYLKEQQSIMQDLITQKSMLIEKFNDQDGHYKKKTDHHEVLEALQQQINDQKNKLFNIYTEYPNKFKDEFVGLCLISFSTKQEQQKVIIEHQISFTQFVYSMYDQDRFNQDLKLMRVYLLQLKAPQPNNINWNNLNKNNSRKLYRLKFFVFYLIFMFLTTISIFIGLQYYQDYTYSKGKEFVQIAFDKELTLNMLKELYFMQEIYIILIAFGIIIVNSYITSKVSNILAEYFQTLTLTNEKRICIMTQIMFLFINQTAVVYLSYSTGHRNFKGPGGFIYLEFYIFLFDAVYPFIYLFNMDKSSAKIKMNIHKKKGKLSNMTQQEANHLCELKEHQIQDQYAILIRSIFNAAFFSCFMPIGLFINSISITIFYWIDKYNLLNKKSVFTDIDQILSNTSLGLLELVILINALGTQAAGTALGQESFLATIGIVLGVFYYLIPNQWFLDGLSDNKTNDDNLTYNEAKNRFADEYAWQNPITKRYFITKEILKKKKEQQDKDFNPQIL